MDIPQAPVLKIVEGLLQYPAPRICRHLNLANAVTFADDGEALELLYKE